MTCGFDEGEKEREETMQKSVFKDSSWRGTLLPVSKAGEMYCGKGQRAKREAPLPDSGRRLYNHQVQLSNGKIYIYIYNCHRPYTWSNHAMTAPPASAADWKLELGTVRECRRAQLAKTRLHSHNLKLSATAPTRRA
jgi:hypothetical protein